MPLLLSTLTALFLLQTAGHAQVGTGLPAAEVDKEIFGTQTPQAFFASRAQDAACQKELLTLKATYVAEKAALERLKGTADLDAIDTQGEKTLDARVAWLEKLVTCGACAVREVKVEKKPVAGKDQYWYAADGSCLVQKTAAEDLKRSFDAKVASLTDSSTYAHYLGGFPDVLEYFLVDGTTGKKLPNGPTTANPFHSFIAIRGPVIFGSQAAFGYFYENKVVSGETQGVRHFTHTFEAIKAPRDFRPPSFVQQHLPSGRTRRAPVVRISRVMGMWHLTEDGYLRYHTSADLGMDLDFAKRLAQSILISTLESMYERGVGEEP